MATVPLIIFSDPICPWCRIGLHRLDEALKANRDPFRRRWRPFQLNPDMPSEGVERKAYLNAKFGGPDGAARVYGAIAEAAEADGLTMNFDRITRTPNTLDAHRLMLWAEAVDAAAAEAAAVEPKAAADFDAAPQLYSRRQDAVAAALFRLYFEEGADLAEAETLVSAGAEAGLDPEFLRAQLATEADRASVLALDADARKTGVRAAPTFLIDGRYVVEGAQPASVWAPIVEEITEKLAAASR
ncbi:MAG: DsbA family oxidoreductase [Pseudomonadota bacterium]